MSAPRPPGLVEHLVLLWGLRLRIGFNRGRRGGRWLAIGAFALSSAPALGLFSAFFALQQVEAVRTTITWQAFILNLLCFVTAAVWVTWPILSAGVDDHSELSRYVAFPISPVRLLLASTLASLFEPRAIVLFAPVVGTLAGIAVHRPPQSWTLAVLLFVLFALLNAAWSRAGLHLVLNVLRAKRSAELIGGGLFVFLVAASWIPPIDTSWLTAVSEGVEALDFRVIQNAALALGRVPPGFLGTGFRALGNGNPGVAAFFASGMAVFTAIGFGCAYALLVRFHRQVGRAGPGRQTKASNPFARQGGTFRTLVIREGFDLWNNPRARLLVAVPFILAILLKLLSGRALFAYFLGPAVDAWLLGGLALYGAIVIASTFSQNAFGYDGRGMGVFLASPVELAQVFRAKNLVHAGAALALGALVVVFYLTYFREGSAWDAALAVAAVTAVLPVLLAAGNFLSLSFPVKFHASLKRRDKLPFAASMLGVAAASLGCAPFVSALRAQGATPANGSTVAWISGAAMLAWGVYALVAPLSFRLLERRREQVFAAVTRE